MKIGKGDGVLELGGRVGEGRANKKKELTVGPRCAVVLNFYVKS